MNESAHVNYQAIWKTGTVLSTLLVIPRFNISSLIGPK